MDTSPIGANWRFMGARHVAVVRAIGWGNQRAPLPPGGPMGLGAHLAVHPYRHNGLGNLPNLHGSTVSIARLFEPP